MIQYFSDKQNARPGSVPEAIRAVIRLSACCICRSRRPLCRTNYICDSRDWERSKQTCMSSCRYGAALGEGVEGIHLRGSPKGTFYGLKVVH